MEGSITSEFSPVIAPLVEHSPFKDPVEQQLFTEWCKENDSLVPQYISRAEWNEKKSEGHLQKDRLDGKSNLFIPEDLHLWEMVNVMEAVDQDTFAHKPEALEEQREKRRDLGDLFINTGIYIAQNLDDVTEGKDAAVMTAQDFYRYGNSLKTGNFDERVPTEEIAENFLSVKSTKLIDEWFGVDKVVPYKNSLVSAQRGRGKDTNDAREVNTGDQRKETIAQYFKAADAAEQGSEPHQKALENVQRKILDPRLQVNQEEIDQELYLSILARGVEKIATELGKDGWKQEIIDDFKKIGYDLEGTEKTLSKVLDIPRLKAELTSLRETGDVDRISEKEKEIALKIQEAISTLPFEDTLALGSMPKSIIERQSIICVGATMIGGDLLKEVGIKYLVGDMPKHSVALIITSDNKVTYVDMMNKGFAKELSDNDFQSIAGKKKVTIDDILKYQNTHFSAGLTTNISTFINNFYAGIDNATLEAISKEFSLYPSEEGTYLQVLRNLGAILGKEEKYEAVLYALKRALKIDKTNYSTNLNLANTLKKMEKFEECILQCNVLLAIDPQSYAGYALRGGSFFTLRNFEKAIPDLEKAALLSLSEEEKLKYSKLKENAQANLEFQRAMDAGSSDFAVWKKLASSYVSKTESFRVDSFMQQIEASQSLWGKYYHLAQFLLWNSQDSGARNARIYFRKILNEADSVSDRPYIELAKKAIDEINEFYGEE